VHRISLLTSLCFREAVRSQVCAWANQFPDKVVWSRESVRWRVSASAIQVTNEVVWCLKSVHWWVCGLANQFPDEILWSRELVHWRVSAFMYQFLDEVVMSRESVGWRMCASGNQFADECVLQAISSLTSMCFPEPARWGIYALSTSPLTSRCLSVIVGWRVRASANQFPDESLLDKSVPD
jgi:hypothetical protein